MSLDTLVADRRACVDVIASDVRAEYVRATTARGRFAIAVPGGSVAVNVFPALAALGLDWSRADIFWVDERAVPPTDPESNYGVAVSRWFEPAGVPDRCVHRMPADSHDLTRAAAAYESELVRALGPSGVLDYVLLGVGQEGHVASLFPGHAALREAVRRVVAIEDAPKPPPRRLTLTLPMLVSAQRVLVAAFGAGKAAMLHDVRTHESSTLPVAMVLRRTLRPKLVVATI